MWFPSSGKAAGREHIPSRIPAASPLLPTIESVRHEITYDRVRAQFYAVDYYRSRETLRPPRRDAKPLMWPAARHAPSGNGLTKQAMRWPKKARTLMQDVRCDISSLYFFSIHRKMATNTDPEYIDNQENCAPFVAAVIVGLNAYQKSENRGGLDGTNDVVFSNDRKTMYVVDYGELYVDFTMPTPFYVTPNSGIIWAITKA